MIAEKTKARPIIFTGESPKWILDGRKTQTRRTNGLDPVNLNPFDSLEKLPSADEFKFLELFERDNNLFARFVREKIEEYFEIKCPYGKVGDSLWVRETFCFCGKQIHFKSDNKIKLQKWTSPYHMPRGDSRINLEITNIRVERLMDISESDASAEGVFEWWGGIGQKERKKITPANEGIEAREMFSILWDSKNKKRGYEFETSPFVWVDEFQSVLPPMDSK